MLPLEDCKNKKLFHEDLSDKEIKMTYEFAKKMSGKTVHECYNITSSLSNVLRHSTVVQ